MARPQCIVVIGAGVVGLNVAWRLAEGGAAVTLVEASRPGAGTSATSFAWVNASSKVDAAEDYFVLNARAVKEHAELAAAGPAGMSATGDIEIAEGSDGVARLADKVGRLNARGYAAEMVSTAGLARLEPDLALPDGTAAAFYAEEGWVDVRAFVSRLLAAATSLGASRIDGDPADEILTTSGRASGVRLASGRTVDADGVVIALGRWTTDFAARFGIDIPLVPSTTRGSKAVGLLARVVPARPPRRLLHARAVAWSPLADGCALLASDAADAAVACDRSTAVAETQARDLIRHAAALNPIFAGARLEEARIGIRALPSDGVTIAGWIHAIPSLYVVVTHSGVTLSPLLGRLVAREVGAQEDAPLLAAFRPGRFHPARAGAS